MGELKILLADEKIEYLLPLEKKYIEGFDDRAEIQLATSREFLQQYFAKPQSVDLAIINENMYDTYLEKHNISHLFLLAEDNGNEETHDLESNTIYKYNSVKEIYNRTASVMGNFKSKEGTKIIYVYSPAGGSGKTTISVGISHVLAQNHLRVLYIETDNLQTSGWITEGKSVLEETVEKSLQSGSDFNYNLIKPYIDEHVFFLLPPFQRFLPTLNIKEEDYCKFVDSVKVSGDFDYIVVDSSGDFTVPKANMMQKADFVLTVAEQCRSGAEKLRCFLSNIDISDQNKFVFVCNKYIENHNSYLDEMIGEAIHIKEYIPYQQDELASAKEIAQIRDIQKLALLFT